MITDALAILSAAVLTIAIWWAAWWLYTGRYRRDPGQWDNDLTVALPYMADGSYYAAPAGEVPAFDTVIPPRIAAALARTAPDETAADWDHSTFPAWLAAVTGRDVEWLLAGVS